MLPGRALLGWLAVALVVAAADARAQDPRRAVRVEAAPQVAAVPDVVLRVLDAEMLGDGRVRARVQYHQSEDRSFKLTATIVPPFVGDPDVEYLSKRNAATNTRDGQVDLEVAVACDAGEDTEEAEVELRYELRPLLLCLPGGCTYQEPVAAASRAFERAEVCRLRPGRAVVQGAPAAALRAPTPSGEPIAYTCDRPTGGAAESPATCRCRGVRDCLIMGQEVCGGDIDCDDEAGTCSCSPR